MRHSSLLFFALALLVPSALPAKSQVDPVALFKFAEGSGAVVGSSVGAPLRAQLSGKTEFVKDGPTGTALRLEGGFAELSEPLVSTSGSFAVSAWVRINRSGGFQTFASVDGDRISAFFLQLRADTGKFAFTVPGTPAAEAGVIVSAGFKPKTGVWYWLVGVHVAEKKLASLYVNGVLQQSVAVKSTYLAAGKTAIGRGRFDGRNVDFCQADVADVAFYSTAKLNASELDRIASTTKARSNTLVVDANLPTRTISPLLYGLMIEDINYSIDGGLYAELIRNRVFKDNPKQPDHWVTVGKSTRIALDQAHPVPTTALTTCLRIDPSGEGAAGAANTGYWGIPVKPNTRYRASLYAKSATPGRVLTVSLQSADGLQTWATTQIRGVSADWKKFAVTLNTGRIAASTNNRLVVTSEGAGSFWINQVSLFPPTYNNRPNGTRPDLMQLMAEMKPSFLRLPGGNYLEGNTIAERFNWRETIGDISLRPGHPNPWGYRSDDGFGLLEYLEWCEDLKIEPILCVFAGYALRGEHIPAGPRLQPFIDEAIEEIEFVMGGPETKGGAKRIQLGHPRPFKLRYVEIGNEDWFDRSGSYDGRFAAYYDAIKARFPALQLIATDKVKSRKPDLLDEHFYKTAEAMAGDVDHYDNYDRNGPKIMVGEWASQDIDKPWERPGEKGPTPSLYSALGDAAWLTGMERNSDIVVMSCYAPMLVNVNRGARQWAVNLIGFDGLRSFGSPSYYVQQMFSLYRGDVVLATRLDGLQPLHHVVSRDTKSGKVFVKLVNMTGESRSLDLDLKSLGKILPKAEKITLTSGRPSDINTIDDPKRVAPVSSTFNASGTMLKMEFPPFSVTALVFRTR